MNTLLLIINADSNYNCSLLLDKRELNFENIFLKLIPTLIIKIEELE
jgi:hypothetical protein